MATTTIVGFNTAGALLRAYAHLALEHRKKAEPAGADSAVGFDWVSKPSVDLGFTASLLVLNAAIFEGTARSLLSEAIVSERERAVREGQSVGRTAPSKAEEFLLKFHFTVELNGGFTKLLEQMSEFFGKPVNPFFDAKAPGLKESVSTLFVLRNVFAHGTTLVQPKDAMDESMKDEYPYNWQSKLSKAANYLEAHFKGADVFKRLADPEVPGHFWEQSVKALELLAAEFGAGKETTRILELIREYSFGYR